ncbi:histidine kinase/DNA gyrase B/HSP90-like ATPase [Kribbella antiqua]|uniref:histidine kinase n=1 Tax=Kribbella antiqua TaxID=2512217 RepID=A0A4V2S1W4_9ACTN|nr:histidine kinase [Kribbella antiqua]TCO38140.1 histidine kinase/DNA gyrase B/HSP90-like ATPase [Kribbella antiqua]
MGAVRDDDRVRRIGGWSLAALTLVLFATVPLSLEGGVMSRPEVIAPGPDLWMGLIIAGFALSGAALIQLRPRNWIGWLLVVSGLLQVTNVAADAYATRALTDPDHSLPLGLAAAWLASWTWFPSLLLPAIVLPPLYPTGRPTSAFWLWHVRVALVGIGLGVLAVASGPGAVDDTVRGTRLPWDAPTWWSWVVGLPAIVLLISTATVTVIGTLVRAIRARTPERQQLLWLLGVVAAMAATIFTEYRVLFAIAYGLVPVAVTIGVLRYRLLGIEVVLRRTLLYLPMTLMVALIFGGLTTAFARLVPEGPLPLLAASAVVAVLVLPVAGRLRVLVDRLVLGERADPLTLVDRVSAGLEVEHDDPVASMLEAVASAAGTSYAVVRDIHGGLVARVGEAAGATLNLPLRHRGVQLGTLTIGPRRGATGVTEQDARLVTALAPHLAVVVGAARLADELARERTRVTTATLAERDRLRRDLHDGLGPSLAGIALGLEAASTAQPSAMPALLERTRAEADVAVREIRRVLDGLRPTSLDLHGLEGAVRETASSLGMGRPGGPAFELRADALPLLPPQVEEAAFRIVAESLTNVARHSAAVHCAVRLNQANGDLRVRVYDDGRGLALGAGSGHGLDSMRRRAADVGGSLLVEGASPHGTLVTAVLPLEAS